MDFRLIANPHEIVPGSPLRNETYEILNLFSIYSHSNIQTTDAVLETSEEMEGDEDKENAEVVEGSVEVSENFVSSTGP